MNKKIKITRGVMFWMTIFSLLTALAIFVPNYTIFLLIAVIAVLLLYIYTDLAVLIIIFLFPYVGIVINFSLYESLKHIPYIRAIDAPLLDFIILGLLVVWLPQGIKKINESTHLLRERYHHIFDFSPKNIWNKIINSIPFAKQYCFFALASLVSIIKAPGSLKLISLKYFLRPILFSYLAFFVIPLNILARNLRLFKYAVITFYFTGLLSAINGLFGLMLSKFSDFPRATPFAFFGISPLGWNHNLLAETLIATAPVGLLITKFDFISQKTKRWVMVGMLFQWTIAILTFARTAWIAILIQIVIYLALQTKDKLKNIFRFAIPIIILLTIISTIFFYTLSTNTVRGSTSSRLEMTKFSWFYFKRSPIIGNGVGTFQAVLNDTASFTMEFGEALDAQGVMLKIMYEQGLFGLISFLVLLLSILLYIFNGWPQKKNNIYLITAAMISVGSIMYQMFNTMYYSSKLWIPLSMAVLIAHYYKKNIIRIPE